ncbi:MAG: tetratricopeptide repeat protein [Candidatus Omnitrophica bacterium]|nr:tetratricopeptide repeat protein [Candidatus Omnitrophota bacterium]
MQSPKKILSIIIVICVLSGMLAYLQALAAPLLWDDEITVSLNQFIRDWKFFPKIWSSPANRGGGEPGNFYRPIQDISFMADYTLWRLNPLGYHLTNLLIHLANIALFVLFLYCTLKWYVDEGVLYPAIFFAAAVFSVHPAIAEPVIYVSGRSAILSTTFWIATFLCVVYFSRTKGARKAGYLIGGVLSFALGILTKESVLTCPLVLIAGVFLVRRLFPTKTVVCWIMLLFTMVGVRLALLWPVDPDHRTLSLIADASFPQRLLTVPAIIAAYPGLLIFPQRLHVEHHFAMTGLFDWRLWVSVIALIFIIAGIIALGRRDKIVYFYGTFFLITLMPVLNIFPIDATIAETWAYLPSMGLFPIAGIALSRFFVASSPAQKKIVTGLFVLYIAALGVRTNVRIYDWRDDLRLYLHDSKLSANSFVLANNVGVAYFRRGNLPEAEKAFQRSVEINNRYAVAHNNLGVVRERQGNLQGALDEYTKAASLSDYYLAYQNLGSLYRRMGFFDQAIASYQKALSIFPENPQLTYERAICYYQKHRWQEARRLLEQVLDREPGHAAALQLLNRIKEEAATGGQ